MRFADPDRWYDSLVSGDMERFSPGCRVQSERPQVQKTSTGSESKSSRPNWAV